MVVFILKFIIFLGNLGKIAWGRASRTDKGVHAALNCISCKLNITQQYLKVVKDFNSDSFKAEHKKEELVDFPKIITSVNENLEDVRVFGNFNKKLF